MSTKCTIALFQRDKESWHLYYDQSDERNHLDYSLDHPDGLSMSIIIPQELIDRIKLEAADTNEDGMAALLRSEFNNGYGKAMDYCRQKVFELNMDMSIGTFGGGRIRGHPYTVSRCRECPAVLLKLADNTALCKANNENIPDADRISPGCPLRIVNAIEIKLSADAIL